MPESTDTSNQDGNTTSEATSGAGDEFQPITSQDDLNRIIGERVKRATSKFGDYKDLQAKAARFDELEQANKTESQRLADAKAAAEQERDAARAEALRLRVATKHGISDEDADLFLTGTDEETLLRQAQRLSDRKGDAGAAGTPKPDLTQGGRGTPAQGSTAQQFASALGDAFN